MKKLTSLLVAIVMAMSISTVAFAAEDITISEPPTAQAISRVTLSDGTVVENYGDGIELVYSVPEEDRGILPRAYGTQSGSCQVTIKDSGVSKYWLQVHGTFNVTSSIVTCISRSQSHGVIDGTNFTFENPHAWHSPANGGSTCWAYATVTVRKWWGGVVINKFDANVRVGYNTAGQKLTNQE